MFNTSYRDLKTYCDTLHVWLLQSNEIVIYSPTTVQRHTFLVSILTLDSSYFGSILLGTVCWPKKLMCGGALSGCPSGINFSMFDMSCETTRHMDLRPFLNDWSYIVSIIDMVAILINAFFAHYSNISTDVAMKLDMHVWYAE